MTKILTYQTHNFCHSEKNLNKPKFLEPFQILIHLKFCSFNDQQKTVENSVKIVIYYESIFKIIDIILITLKFKTDKFPKISWFKNNFETRDFEIKLINVRYSLSVGNLSW